MSSLDLDLCIAKLKKCEMLSETQVKGLCAQLKQLLLTESNVCSVSTPVTVVGDVHGQFFDVLELFEVCGNCPDTNYLFLGDYVDRGYYSVETISLLICMKLRWPDRVTMLRGNHESRQITQVYGFYSECMRKYGSAVVWNSFVDMFDYLSVAALVDAKLYCVHGGLSPSVESIDQIRVLNRFQEVHEGAMSDMMWSDPDPEVEGFQPSQRGAGYTFGVDVVQRFCETNKVVHVVRSHQLCMDGFQEVFENLLTTIWSAPNYCYRCGNVAAAMEVTDGMVMSFNTFLAAPDAVRKQPDLETNREVPQYFL